MNSPLILRVIGAVLRAILVVLLVVVPGILIPNVSHDGHQIVVLAGLFAAGVVFADYLAQTPILISFRDAPPYNRLRFLTLFSMVFVVSVLVRGGQMATPLALMVTDMADMLAQVLDFPFSPLRMSTLMLPENADAQSFALMRVAAGVSLFLGILGLLVFMLYIRLIGWPGRGGEFNILLNLPMFDPTAGRDIVERLSQKVRINFVIGLVLPYALPLIIKSAGSFIDPLSFDHPLTLVWATVFWAFLPAMFLMRAVAIQRMVRMIEVTRRRRYERAMEDHAFA